MQTIRAFRLGVIGAAGRAARRFLDAAIATPGIELAGVCDLRREECRALARRMNAKYYGSHGRLLASEDIDGVVVCVPPSRRPKVTEEALAQGKPTLVPLPIASSIAEAEPALRSAADSPVTADAAAGFRFLRQAQRAAEIVWTRELGRVRAAVSVTQTDVEGDWLNQGGGALMGPAAHSLDLLVWALGMPRRVAAAAWPRNEEPEQAVSAVLDYDDGTHALVRCGPPAWPLGERFEVFGELGRLVMTERAHVEVVGESPAPHPPESEPAHDLDWAVGAALADFAAAAATGRRPRAALADAAGSLELANAILLAAHTGRTVDLPLDRDAYGKRLRQLRKAEREGRPGG